MAVNLRDAIRKYEADNNTQLKCKLSRLRCLRCVFSVMGCPGAKRWMRPASRT